MGDDVVAPAGDRDLDSVAHGLDVDLDLGQSASALEIEESLSDGFELEGLAHDKCGQVGGRLDVRVGEISAQDQ